MELRDAISVYKVIRNFIKPDRSTAEPDRKLPVQHPKCGKSGAENV